MTTSILNEAIKILTEDLDHPTKHLFAKHREAEKLGIEALEEKLERKENNESSTLTFCHLLANSLCISRTKQADYY